MMEMMAVVMMKITVLISSFRLFNDNRPHLCLELDLRLCPMFNSFLPILPFYSTSFPSLCNT